MTSKYEYRNPDYPYYEPGTVLPEGLFPPMPGYTHEDLINAACGMVYRHLIDAGVNETLANETTLALATHINARFESELAEYKISAYFNKPYASRALRDKSVSQMASHFSDLAGIAAVDCLDESSLLQMGKAFCLRIVDLVKETVQSQILRLNEQSFVQGS